MSLVSFNSGNWSDEANNITQLHKKITRTISDPDYFCKTFSNEKYTNLQKIKRYIALTGRIICLLIIAKCFFSLLISIPGEIKNRIYFLDSIQKQERETCYMEYVENMCNTTKLPDLLEFCQEKLDCFQKPFRSQSFQAFGQYFIDMKTIFFETLSSRSSALLGITLGLVSYFIMKKISHLFD